MLESVFEENISDETLDLLGMAHLPVRNILLEPGADIDQTKLNNFYL
jgi:hypothetical protein